MIVVSLLINNYKYYNIEVNVVCFVVIKLNCNFWGADGKQFAIRSQIQVAKLSLIYKSAFVIPSIFCVCNCSSNSWCCCGIVDCKSLFNGINGANVGIVDIFHGDFNGSKLDLDVGVIKFGFVCCCQTVNHCIVLYRVCCGDWWCCLSVSGWWSFWSILHCTWLLILTC